MIERCYLVTSDSISPYYNLALEDYLFHHIPANSMILYLWQNQNTVVIGKNQNAYKECNLREMEYDHCYLARRSSGGGAVFHDLGNLNYTFLTYVDSYDIGRQTQTIINALKMFGLPAVATGRNDIEINGFKISGNAYLTERERCLHHGTILWNADKNKAQKYLNTSARKIQAKGVDSVSSRIANLTDFIPELKLEHVKNALISSFTAEYGQLYEMPVTSDLTDLIEHYHSYRYLYNTINEYTIVIHDFYSFGELQMYADFENGKIRHTDIYTDALDIEFKDRLTRLFEGLSLDDAEFRRRHFEVFGFEVTEDAAKMFEALKQYKYY